MYNSVVLFDCQIESTIVISILVSIPFHDGKHLVEYGKEDQPNRFAQVVIRVRNDCWPRLPVKGERLLIGCTAFVDQVSFMVGGEVYIHATAVAINLDEKEAVGMAEILKEKFEFEDLHPAEQML